MKEQLIRRGGKMKLLKEDVIISMLIEKGGYINEIFFKNK